MAEPSPHDQPRRRLYNLVDDEGRTWLDELVEIVNDGGYTEAINAFRADEAKAIAPGNNA